MSKFYEMVTTHRPLRETIPVTNAGLKGRSRGSGSVMPWVSHTILGIGTVVFIWLLCTAFTLAPAQTKAFSSATHTTTSSLPAAWSGWKEVPPRNGFTLSGPAATVYQGRSYLFVRGTDNRIYQNRLTNNSWSGWSEVPPRNGFTPDAPAVTVYQNKLYLFVQGTDNRIYQNRLTNNNWSGWSEVPPRNSLTLSGPGATVYQGQLYLFVQGTDNRIYQNRLNAHGMRNELTRRKLLAKEEKRGL